MFQDILPVAEDFRALIARADVQKQPMPRRNLGKGECPAVPEKLPGLQGFSDEMFDKAAAVNSDAQLYKQAGNGVTIPVVYAVGKRIVEIQNELNKEGI